MHSLLSNNYMRCASVVLLCQGRLILPTIGGRSYETE